MPPGRQSRGRPSDVSRGGAGPTVMFEGEEWMDARAPVEKFKPAISGYEAFVNLWCMMPSVVSAQASSQVNAHKLGMRGRAQGLPLGYPRIRNAVSHGDLQNGARHRIQTAHGGRPSHFEGPHLCYSYC